MDPTLVVILLVLVTGTVLAIMQSRRRDKCLRHFSGYHVTLAEKDGNLSWGRTTVFPTGLEVVYQTPVRAPAGHLERSYIFYKEQYAAMDGLYRYPEGLPESERQRRAEVIRRTVNPSVLRRVGRKLRNWLGMVRDALVQAIGVIIGVAKTRNPGSAVLSTQEQGIKALSSEIIGHTGNLYDPLLESHLYSQVVVEITRSGERHSFCGWLKDYSAEFIEVLDAVVNTGPTRPPAMLRPGEPAMDGVEVALEEGRLRVANLTASMLFMPQARIAGSVLELNVVLPTGFTADLRVPGHLAPGDVEVSIETAQRVDFVVPRSHALIRHAADGTEALVVSTERSVVAEAVEARDEKSNKPPSPALPR